METTAHDGQSQPLCCWQKGAAWARGYPHTKLSNGVCIPEDGWHKQREAGTASQPEDKKPQLFCALRVTQDIRNSSSSRSIPANTGARTVTEPVSPISVLPCSVTHHLACGTRQEPFTGRDSEHPLRCSGMESAPPPLPCPSPQHICS